MAEHDRERTPLRIGVNLVPLSLRIGGMRQYVLQLLPAMIRRSNHRFVLFHLAKGLPDVRRMLGSLTAAERSRVTAIELRYTSQVIAWGDEFDLYFCPLNGFTPQLLDRPSLATIADVQEQYFPQNFTEKQLRTRAEVFPNTAHAVTTLLTISEYSRQCICQAFDVPAEKVRAVPLAPNQALLDAQPAWPADCKPLPERYFVYPASLYPHKNHTLLLRAMRGLIDAGHDCSLMLTGHRVTPGTDIDAAIAELGLGAHVRWLGHVSAGMLGHLYAHAEALVFPSLFEGFGMPLVEAMHFDCPVIAVDSTCVAEICGDAALLIPPDEPALRDAMARLLNDRDLRQTLIQSGRSVARRFSVDRLADRTLDAVDEAHDRFWKPPGTGDRSISCIIGPSRDEAALEFTLLSLFEELGDGDEIVLAGRPRRYGHRLRELCDNSDAVRFVGVARPAAVVAATRHDTVLILPAGTSLCRGATATARAAIGLAGDRIAVVGDVFSHGRDGKHNGIVHLTTRASCGTDAQVPVEAAFWRRQALQTLVEPLASFEQFRRPVLPAGRAMPLYRTVSSLPSGVWMSPSTVRPSLLNRVINKLRQGPTASVRSGVRLARRVGRRIINRIS